jgi:integrase-like protein
VQQLREAFPYESLTRFLLLDHDSKYGSEVFAAIRSMNIKAVRTSVGCPWQNGMAERWVGSCRRELLDHVIAINESRLKRLLASYVSYYHEDRTHCGLGKQTPQKRTRSSGRGMVVAWPRVGALLVMNESADRYHRSIGWAGRASPFAHSVCPVALLFSLSSSTGSDFDLLRISKAQCAGWRVEMRRLELWRMTALRLLL